MYEYNQKNQLVKTTFNTHIRDVLEQEYDAEGNVSRVYHFPRKKSKVLFSKREYDEYKQVILRKDHAYRSQNKFDGINNIYIQKGDISIIKTEYFENGLIANETEWLNDVLVSFREFEYLKKPSKSTNN